MHGVSAVDMALGEDSVDIVFGDDTADDADDAGDDDAFDNK